MAAAAGRSTAMAERARWAFPRPLVALVAVALCSRPVLPTAGVLLRVPPIPAHPRIPLFSSPWAEDKPLQSRGRFEEGTTTTDAVTATASTTGRFEESKC